MSKERPILFSAPMVRAILDGSKTQTRRIMKPQPTLEGTWVQAVIRGGTASYGSEQGFRESHPGWCPHGWEGDRLWVRETWRVGEDVGHGWQPGHDDGDLHVIYEADGAREYLDFPTGYQWPKNAKVAHNSEGTPEHWISYGPIPCLFMPRWASRIDLEITGVRVERLQDIHSADALAEGITDLSDDWHVDYGIPGVIRAQHPVRAYQMLWESINGPGSWDANPWVWVVEFR